MRNVAFVALALVAAPALADAPLRIDREITSSKEISLEVGQNRLMESSVPLGRISVADPAVVDFKAVTSTQLLVTAKGVGDTYLTLWDKNDQPLVLSLHVTRNLDALRKQIRELFPEEQINVSAAGDLVVLSGEVSDVRLPERVVSVAKLQAPKLANLLRVRGNQQVQLEVKFAEVSRQGLRELGFNFFHNNGNRVAGMSGPTTAVDRFVNQPHTPFYVPGADIPGVPAVYNSPFPNAFSLFFSGLNSFPFSAIVSLLQQNDLAKTLAEPTMVAMTGQQAQFLAGGEFPIPLATGFGTVQVEFKKFGILLKFTPTVLSDGQINLHLNTEVSEIDPSLSVTIGGFTVPGLSTRQSETTVRMRDGQSFAIAGLLSDKVRSSVGKLPLLGDIPVLGALFRSTNYRREETELLVVITAKLVRPVSPQDAPLMPGEEELNDPDDFELFLLGRTGKRPREPQARNEAIPVKGQRSGPVGDIGYQR